MPCSKAEGLVLTVDPNVIHKVDTHNAQNLFNMWTGKCGIAILIARQCPLTTHRCSLLQVCGLGRTRPEIRKPQLAVMESGNLLLRFYSDEPAPTSDRYHSHASQGHSRAGHNRRSSTVRKRRLPRRGRSCRADHRFRARRHSSPQDYAARLVR